MAKTKTDTESQAKRIKQCECSATAFQGPFHRGEFVDGTFVVKEEVYQCRNCHREWTLAEVLGLAERVTG